jgi:predicted transcriptional regulator
MRKEELKNLRQYKARTKQHLYISNVPLDYCVRFDLSPTELLIYCYIKNVTENAPMKTYSGSVKNLCSVCNISMPTARKALDKLQREGFIVKEFRDKEIQNQGIVETVCYTANDFKQKDMSPEDIQARCKLSYQLREDQGIDIVNGKRTRRRLPKK